MNLFGVQKLEKVDIIESDSDGLSDDTISQDDDHIKTSSLKNINYLE